MLEGGFNKIWNDLTGETERREDSAKEQMTYEQMYASQWRESYVKLKSKLGFKGDITEANMVLKDKSEASGNYTVFYEAVLDGHTIAGRFDCARNDVDRRLYGPWENVVIQVDGQTLREEAGLVFIDKYGSLIKMKLEESSFADKAPQSVIDMGEAEKRAQENYDGPMAEGEQDLKSALG